MTKQNSSFFTKYEGNPLRIPTYGGRGVVHPNVLFFPKGFDGYNFWLYYTPFPPESAENPCLVRSNDGINFTDKGISNPLLTPGSSGFDDGYLADPDIIYLNGKFFMLYVGVKSGGIGQIGLAQSDDGINFVKYEKNPILQPTQAWESKHDLLTPTVYFDGGEFHVLYEAKGPRKVGYAFGDSLHNLQKYDSNPVLGGGTKNLVQRLEHKFPFSLFFRFYAPTEGTWDAEAVNHLKLVRFDQQYYLFFVGRNRRWSHDPTCRLGLAMSKDLKTWKKDNRNPIMSPSCGWESQSIYRACPAIVDDKIYLYYSAFSENVPHIGLAFSDLKALSEMS